MKLLQLFLYGSIYYDKMGVDCRMRIIVYVEIDLTYQNLKHILNLCLCPTKFDMNKYKNHENVDNDKLDTSKISFDVAFKEIHGGYVTNIDHVFICDDEDCDDIFEQLIAITNEEEFEKLFKRNDIEMKKVLIFKTIFNESQRAHTILHTENVLMANDEQKTNICDFEENIKQSKNDFMRHGFDPKDIFINASCNLW